jgi:DNA-binding LacI/PurR family transcriptional regulator/AraC-like DNA-binding protein/signal transduction histidine kinase
MNVRQKKAKRLRIGLLLASIHTGSSNDLWSAVHKQAEEMDIDLCIFPGGPLGDPGYEGSQRNVIYELAKPGSLDGIVSWASSLGGAAPLKDVVAFHQRFRGMPCVTLNYPIPGFPCIQTDAYGGMKKLVKHFIKMHKARSIAFIRGPATHVSAEDRYKAFLETLREEGIELDSSLVTDPMPWNAGEEAVQLLLDDRGKVPGKDFDALIGASDLQVFRAVQVLQARGYEIPGDVIVGGFNDITESRIVSPQLTTVSMPFKAEGQEALKLLIHMVQGKDSLVRKNLSTQLIIRQSCGCPSYRTIDADPSSRNLGQRIDVPSLIQRVGHRIRLEEPYLQAWVGPLISALIEDLQGSKTSKFLTILQTILERLIHTDKPISPWQDTISILRKGIPSLYPGADLSRLEALCSQARVMISDALERSRILHEWIRQQNDLLLREIGRKLLMTLTIEQLKELLQTELPRLGIPGFSLYLYTEISGGLDFDKIVHPEHRSTFILQPLFQQNEPLGCLVLEAGNPDASVYEELRTYISSAVKGILLYEQAIQAKNSAELAERIKSKILARISEEFRHPVAFIATKATETLNGAKKNMGSFPPGMRDALLQIRQAAEEQLHRTNQLLDVAKADIEDLNLEFKFWDITSLLSSILSGRKEARRHKGTEWILSMPEQLPWILLDKKKFIQMVDSVLEAADMLAAPQGKVEVVVQIELPFIRIRITEIGISLAQEPEDRIFQLISEVGFGGLGIPLARHLATLQGGRLDVDSTSRKGTTFNLYLPLPSLGGLTGGGNSVPVLLYVSRFKEPGVRILELADSLGLEPVQAYLDEDWEKQLQNRSPAAIVWDSKTHSSGDWAFFHILRHHPLVLDVPFLCYPDESLNGSFGPKLMDLLDAACPGKRQGPIVIVSPSPEIREQFLECLEKRWEGGWIRTYNTLKDAHPFLQRESPGIIFLDVEEPISELPYEIPPGYWIVALCPSLASVLPSEEVRRKYALLRIHRGLLPIPKIIDIGFLLTASGMGAGIERRIQILEGTAEFIEKNFSRSISRWQLAQQVNVSEDYLSRVFKKLIGISPWKYLLRYRILQSEKLLQKGGFTINEVAESCGFQDQAYFCRVFRTFLGVPPGKYQKQTFLSS